MGVLKNIWNNKNFIWHDLKAMGSGAPANEYELSRFSKLFGHIAEYEKAMFGKHYDAGNVGRLQDDWGTSYATPTSNLKAAWKTIIARAIKSAENNPHTVAILNTLISNIIGTGLKPQPRVKKSNGDPVEGVNKILAEGWNRYNDEWDATGRNTHLEAQKIRFGEMFRTGSTITNKIKAPKENYLSIQNQIVHVLRLDDSYDWQSMSFSSPDIKNTVFGINLNEYGRAVSYYVQGIKDPVSAKNMRLSFKQTLAEQYIGIPWLTAALKYLWANESLIKDKLIASRIQAMVGLFVPDSLATKLFKGQKNTDDQLEMKSGRIWTGQKGNEPVVVQADDSVKDVLIPLQTLLLHAISMTFGISYQAITRDLVKTNMASGRINTNEDRKTYKHIQKWFAKEICQPDWNEFVFRMFLEGKVQNYSITDYMRDPWKYNQCQWQPTGFDFIDPYKEAMAAIELHDNNMLSLKEWYGERGQEWKPALEQISEEKEFMKEKKIEIKPKPIDQKQKVIDDNDKDEE